MREEELSSGDTIYYAVALSRFLIALGRICYGIYTYVVDNR